MITPIRGEYLVAPGVEPRHAHRVFDGLGAGVGEEDLRRSVKGVIKNEFGSTVA